MSQENKLRSRIATLKKLNSIFSALQVITVAKLPSARERQKSARLYKDGLFSSLLLSGSEVTQQKQNETSVAAILIAGNRGLCGTFNQDIFFRAKSFLLEQKGKKIQFYVLGGQGYKFLTSKNLEIYKYYPSTVLDFFAASVLASELWQSFKNGFFSDVYLIYNRFYSMLNLRAVAERIFPRDMETDLKKEGRIIFEPDQKTLAEKLSFLHFEAVIYSAVCESCIGELSARMVTLKSAIDNSKDLIDQLILQKNKARQQSITQEILEIVEASEALVGEE